VDQQTDRWTAVDDYLGGLVLGPDPDLEAALDAASAAGLPQIQVSPPQGRMLTLLARMMGARRVLEIGTLGGYSTICLARALPSDGALVTLELSPDHADVARANIARAGLEKVVAIRVGRAVDSLRQLESEGQAPFDLVFIDADKASNPDYLDYAVRLGHPGTVIVLDNAIRGGAIAEPERDDPDVTGTRAALERMGNDPRLFATVIQTVGGKGYDGFALAVLDTPR
jgi:predicted O-methyltransferase YrrM